MKKIQYYGYVDADLNKTTLRKLCTIKVFLSNQCTFSKHKKSSVGAEGRTYLAFGETEEVV